MMLSIIIDIRMYCMYVYLQKYWEIWTGARSLASLIHSKRGQTMYVHTVHVHVSWQQSLTVKQNWHSYIRTYVPTVHQWESVYVRTCIEWLQCVVATVCCVTACGECNNCTMFYVCTYVGTYICMYIMLVGSWHNVRTYSLQLYIYSHTPPVTLCKLHGRHLHVVMLCDFVLLQPT